MLKPRVILQLRPSHVAGEGYIAHLVVADKALVLDVILSDMMAADDFHSALSASFSACGIDLVEDLWSTAYAKEIGVLP